MKKNSLQWFGALALMVVSALAFVACSSDSGGGGVPDNSKIVGTWVVKQVSPSDDHGPRVGQEMTFNANGTFTSGGDEGTYTYNSETGAFTATMGEMTMSGTFVLNGDEATGSVNVTAGGQTKKYEMTMAKKGAEPAVSSTKMVGTWKVVKDSNPDESQVGKTAVFNENGTCTWGGKSYTYTCEEQEDGSLNYAIFDGNKQVTNGLLVLVNDGNVLNGNYVYAQSSIKSVICGMVLKKPSYNYPTSGVQGRWQFTFVAGPFGNSNDDYFVARLPVLDYNRNDGGDVFVIGDNGELYVEGNPYVGNYSFSSNNQLKLQFAGKYVAYVQGLIEFSGVNTMNIPQGKGTFKSSATSGETLGFKGTIQRVIEENNGGGEEVDIDERMLGDWTVMTDEGDPDAVGKTMTFNEDGTWENANYQSGTYTGETQEDGRIVFNIYNEDDVQLVSGKLIVVSGGNVLTGEYSPIYGEKAKNRAPNNDKYRIVMKKANYTYPSGGIKGRWEMTACSLGENAPIGNVLVFENNAELYIEGDPHVGTYNKQNSNLMMTFGDDSNTTISGTVNISGTTASLTNATLSRNGQQIASGVTATLVKQ